MNVPSEIKGLDQRKVPRERGVPVSASKRNYTSAKVIWFNDEKGFGYAQDHDGNLIFIHYTAIISKAHARRSLEKEQEIEVQFSEEFGELRATKVRDVRGNA